MIMDELLITLTNILLKRFKLKWDGKVLRHYTKLLYGNKEVLISDDYEIVVKLLGMPKKPLPTFDDIYYNIINSKYFNKKIFKVHTVEDHLRAFLDRLKEDNPPNGYECHIKEINPLYELKKHIKLNSRIVTCLLNTTVYTNRLPELRNKFNGNLIKIWTSVDNPFILSDLIKEFKIYITDDLKEVFYNYLLKSSPKEIKTEFKIFYIRRVEKLAGTYLNTLPF